MYKELADTNSKLEKSFQKNMQVWNILVIFNRDGNVHLFKMNQMFSITKKKFRNYKISAQICNQKWMEVIPQAG